MRVVAPDEACQLSSVTPLVPPLAAFPGLLTTFPGLLTTFPGLLTTLPNFLTALPRSLGMEGPTSARLPVSRSHNLPPFLCYLSPEPAWHRSCTRPFRSSWHGAGNNGPRRKAGRKG